MIRLLDNEFDMVFLLTDKRILAYSIHYTPELAREHLQKIRKFHNLEGEIVFDSNLEKRFEKIIKDRILRDYLVNIDLDIYKYREVYNYLLKLQRGQVITYSDLAERTGYRIREVIYALKHNPFLIIIPCHRVIRKDEGVSEYTPLGREFKAKLLQMEGVKIKKNF